MFEIEWNPKKSVYRNLLLIKGISTTLARKISALLGISGKTLFRELSSHKVNKLKKLLSWYRKKTTPFMVTSNVEQQENKVENFQKDYLMLDQKEKETLSPKGSGQGILHTPIITSLDEFKKEKIKILINLNTLRGRRYKQGYPVRGQRTRSNAKTARRLNRMIH